MLSRQLLQASLRSASHIPQQRPFRSQLHSQLVGCEKGTGLHLHPSQSCKAVWHAITLSPVGQFCPLPIQPPMGALHFVCPPAQESKFPPSSAHATGTAMNANTSSATAMLPSRWSISFPVMFPSSESAIGFSSHAARRRHGVRMVRSYSPPFEGGELESRSLRSLQDSARGGDGHHL
jgi:hypothetical protein